MRRLSLRAPVRGGVGQAAPFKGHPGPGPSGGCALCATLVSASVPKFEGAKCRHAQRRWYARVWSPQRSIVRCKESAALCSTAAGRPGAKGRVSVQDRHTTFVPVPPRYGFAVVQPGRYSSMPLPGRIPPEAFRAPRTRPSAFAPVRWRRECRASSARCGSQDCLPCLHASHAARHPLRRRPRISDVAVVFLFEGQCLFAKIVVPRINVITRSLLWAVPAQAPEAVCLPHKLPVFVGVWEPKVS